jgi:hypothetical protein
LGGAAAELLDVKGGHDLEASQKNLGKIIIAQSSRRALRAQRRKEVMLPYYGPGGRLVSGKSP